MKKIFTSLKKSASLIAILALSGMTFNASAEKLSGNTASEIVAMMTTGWNLGTHSMQLEAKAKVTDLMQKHHGGNPKQPKK